MQKSKEIIIFLTFCNLRQCSAVCRFISSLTIAELQLDAFKLHFNSTLESLTCGSSGSKKGFRLGGVHKLR